ncbi:MAG: hypothetical protein ABSD56_01825 [Bryobacteraceae bacterium]
MRAQYAKLAGRVALLRGLAEGERAYVGPAYVTVDTTRRCSSVWRWIAPLVPSREKAPVR